MLLDKGYHFPIFAIVLAFLSVGSEDYHGYILKSPVGLVLDFGPQIFKSVLESFSDPQNLKLALLRPIPALKTVAQLIVL